MGLTSARVLHLSFTLSQGNRGVLVPTPAKLSIGLRLWDDELAKSDRFAARVETAVEPGDLIEHGFIFRRDVELGVDLAPESYLLIVRIEDEHGGVAEGRTMVSPPAK
jgi:hypothetical protein